ncbi:unnamed protein product, partial [Didymodactylos carnosus]
KNNNMYLRSLLIIGCVIDLIYCIPIAPNDAENSKKLLEKTLELFDKMGSEKMFNVGVELGLSQSPLITSDMKNKIKEFIEKYCSFNHIKIDLAKVYMDYFNLQDIEHYIEFYSTEFGQKFVRLQPIIVEQSQIMTQQLLKKHASELQATLLQ